MNEIVLHDRYSALGIPRPRLETMCLGDCEGTGWVPVYRAVGDERTGSRIVPLDNHVGEEKFDAAWQEAHDEAHGFWNNLKRAWDLRDLGLRAMWRRLWEPCDGWHFVKCPDCSGTGKRKEEE